jgi:Contractile injection system tape measure protein
MRHVINTQQIDLLIENSGGGIIGGLGESKMAFKLQEQASRQFYSRVLPLLERVFDKLGPEGEIVSIDELVIDIGAITAEKLEDGSWADDLYIKVLEQAEELIREGGGQRRLTRRPVGAGLVEQWLAYMRTGRLPWNLTAIDREWLQRVLEHLAADHGAVMAVRKALAGSGSLADGAMLLRRVVQQHDESFLVSLMEVLTAQNQAGLPGALGELALIWRELASIRRELAAMGTVSDGPDVGGGGALWVGLPDANKKMLFTSILKLAATEAAVWTTEEFVRTLLKDLGLKIAEVNTVRERLAGQLDISGPLLAEVVATRDDERTRMEVVSRDEKPGAPSKEQTTLTKNDPRKEPDKQSDKELEEGIFVPYAGFVLLHAFLPTFLERVGLVHEGIFVADTARMRAVQLLQYAATGLTDNPEYELVIAKLLCALPLEEPVGREFEPTAMEAEEADALLDACLAQWAALQNTSREGLRVNFLNRNGMLTRKNGQLRLEVEKMAYDMLLDQLPWNISLIKLPWMQEILHVNWR